MGKPMDESADVYHCVSCGQRTFLKETVLGHLFCGECIVDFNEQVARSGHGRLAIQFRPDDGGKRPRRFYITLRPEQWHGAAVVPLRG